jgi:hypothetical protein
MILFGIFAWALFYGHPIVALLIVIHVWNNE